MSITGFLSDFSLSEIFQFIAHGNRTGVLVLRSLPQFPTIPPALYYLWVEEGCLVAATNQLNQQGLLSLIEQYQWISPRVVNKLARWCPPDQPLGLYLRHQGALRGEELDHLFQIQIVRQFCILSQLKDAQFKFDQSHYTLPRREMTGLSLPGQEISILLKKLSLLRKLFAARKIREAKTPVTLQSDKFCTQLNIALDVAFFHAINLSLFKIDYTLTDLVQLVELYYCPYNLPKSRLLSSSSDY